jgi:hypothetical protein
VSDLLDRLHQARLDLHYAEVTLRKAEDHVAQLELRVRHHIVSTAGGDYKVFGPNESAQKAELAYQIAQDADLVKRLTEVRNAQEMASRCRVELDCALDARREQEYELQRRRLELDQDQSGIRMGANA